jgi:hypothetical protein
MPYFGPFAANWVGIWVGDFFDAEGISSLGSCQHAASRFEDNLTSRCRTYLEARDGSKLRRPAWESSRQLILKNMALTGMHTDPSKTAFPNAALSYRFLLEG